MTFLDYKRIQSDLAHLLLSDPELARVNIVARESLIENEARLPDQTLALEVLAYLIEREGRHGCGVIVERPELVNPAHLRVKFLVLEERNMNEDPQSGTLIAADFVAQRILEVAGLGFGIGGVGSLSPDEPCIVTADDFESLTGYRVNLNLDFTFTQTTRLACPSIDETALTITLTPPTGADAWYTTDNSFPSSSNPAATLYTAPFAVASGTTVRWRATQADYLPSSVATATIV